MRMRALRRDTKGQALLEFALILPVLLLLVLGIVEFGRAWNLAQMMSDVAREGTRLAVVQNGQTEQQVKDFMANKLETAGVPIEALTGGINFTATGGAWHTDTIQTGTITIPYTWMFFRKVFKPLTLTSSFTMRME